MHMLCISLGPHVCASTSCAVTIAVSEPFLSRFTSRFLAVSMGVLEPQLSGEDLIADTAVTHRASAVH